GLRGDHAAHNTDKHQYIDNHHFPQGRWPQVRGNDHHDTGDHRTEDKHTQFVKPVTQLSDKRHNEDRCDTTAHENNRNILNIDLHIIDIKITAERGDHKSAYGKQHNSHKAC